MFQTILKYLLTLIIFFLLQSKLKNRQEKYWMTLSSFTKNCNKLQEIKSQWTFKTTYPWNYAQLQNLVLHFISFELIVCVIKGKGWKISGTKYLGLISSKKRTKYLSLESEILWFLVKFIHFEMYFAKSSPNIWLYLL